MSFLALYGLVLAYSAPGPRIGIAMIVPPLNTEARVQTAMRQQKQLGLDGAALRLNWDEFEANDKVLTTALTRLQKMNQEALLTIGIIDTVKRRLPADVAAKAWDDLELLKRFDAFMGKVLPKLDKRVKWISLGNEVNVYLGNHPDEVDAYLKFLVHEREVIHKALPKTKVGVTALSPDAMKSPDLIRKLQEGMDMTVFTYYPMDGNKVAPTDKFAAHFDFMAGIAGKRPLVFQEIGYPSSPRCGSSDAMQAAFVKEVFKQLDRFGARIALATFFCQSDLPSWAMQLIVGYYGGSDTNLGAFLGTLGFCDETGKPRAAWSVFKSEVSKRKPKR